MPPDSKEKEFGRSYQEAFSSAGKYHVCAGKCAPENISSGMDISEVPGHHFKTMNFGHIIKRV